VRSEWQKPTIIVLFVISKVVGYAGATNVIGNKIYGGNFALVNGSTALKLSDITVTGYIFDGEFLGLVKASKLNEFGSTPKDGDGDSILWTWADWEEEVEEGVFERFTGWVDKNGEFIGETIDIPMGEGLWVQSDDTRWTMQCAGAVYAQTTPCQLVVGNRICANPCPGDIKLGQCVVTGYVFDGEFLGLVKASKLNEFGSTPKDGDGDSILWTWADWEEEVEEGVVERFTGWVDKNGDFVGETIDIPLGEGLWVQSDDTRWNFVFPTLIGE